MLKVKCLVVVFLGIVYSINAQNIDGFCSETDLFGIAINQYEIQYQKYLPTLQLKERYSFFNEVKNNTVEELIISQMSVRDNDWLSYNFNKKTSWKEAQFNRIINQNKEKNYLELVRKVSYTFENENYSIVRINVFDEKREKPIVVSLIAKKKGGRWFLFRNKTKTPLEFLLMTLNLKYLDAVFENRSTKNLKLNDLIENSWDSDKFNITRLYSEIGKIMRNDIKILKSVFERNNSSFADSKTQPYSTSFLFKESIVKTDYLLPLLNQKYCHYFFNEISEFDTKEIKQILNYIEQKENVNKEGKISVFPIHKFSFKKNNRTLILIKYIIKKEEDIIKTEVIELQGNVYKEYRDLTVLDKQIKYFIEVSKPELINEFSNVKNNPDYPEINKLKPLVQDSQGVLNIEKLAKVLKENKSALSKYLD